MPSDNLISAGKAELDQLRQSRQDLLDQIKQSRETIVRSQELIRRIDDMLARAQEKD